MLFQTSKDAMMEEVSTGSYLIEESACAEAKIFRAIHRKAKDTQSEGIQFETDKARATIWFKNSKGEEIERGVKLLTHISVACGIKVKDYKMAKEKDNFGNEIDVITNFKDVELGFFFRHKFDEYNGKIRSQYDIEGCFDPKTKLTPVEAYNKKKKPERHPEMMAKYEKLNASQVKPALKGSAPSSNMMATEVDDEDEFPY